MRSATRRWLAVIALGTGALAIVLYFASTVDRRPPQVSSYQLTQHLVGDAAVALTTTSVEVVFNEAVEHATAESAFEMEPGVEGAFSWSGTTMIFTPQERLPLETEFTVRIDSGVRDLAGNEMPAAAAPFSFVTVGRPTVVETDPGDGEQEVPLEATIIIVFSTLMDTASIEGSLRVAPQISYRLQWNGERLEIIPERPLDAGRAYRLEIDSNATDQDGLELAEPMALTFETVPPGLAAEGLIPRDGSEGVAVTSQIGVTFDGAIDPDSLDLGAFTVTPEVAGSIELVDNDDGARLLRFTPSSALPPNTTFSVELAPGLRDLAGRRLAEPIGWTFTTGAPLSALSNHVVFISERAGVPNLWAMNFDGSGQRQLSVELNPVLDYAVSPDGRSFVVSDGFRLVAYQADGTARRVLTDPAHLEFDPAFAPDGTQLAFVRVDATSGESLGLWERPTEGGDATPIEFPEEFRPGASPPADPASPLLRAPVYSPDWSALAFVDVTGGRVGILELPGERVTSAPLLALATPSWRADSTGVLLAGVRQSEITGAQRIDPREPVHPLSDSLVTGDSGDADAVRLERGATAVVALGIDEPVVHIVAGPTGRVAYLSPADPLGRSDPNEPAARRLAVIDADGDRLDPLPDAEDVAWVTFGAEPATLVVERHSGIWLVRLDGAEPLRLSRDGARPRWLP